MMFKLQLFGSRHLKQLRQHSRIFQQIYYSNSAAESGSDNRRSSQDHFSDKKNFVKFASIVGVGTALAVWLKGNSSADAESSWTDVSIETKNYGNVKPGLPEYNSDQVSEHNSLDSGVWISFRHGVYDITNFVKEHPGGDKILLGAGASVEPFWALYAVHKTPHVLELLEKFRIGNLSEDDVESDLLDMADPYALEPKRHAVLKATSEQPFNAEPPLPMLVQTLRTPNEMFYVRNHLPVPSVDPSTYELEIEGMSMGESSLKLGDIKTMPKCTITVAVQCGGNRRSEMTKVKPVKGLTWGQAAIGNADWSGAKLCDVLKRAGFKEDSGALHVQFEGLDLDPTGSPYGASIPIEKALDPNGGVILAYEMNGEPIPPDHGYPIRLIAPGAVGARNVKWLGRIIVSKEESDSHWQQNDYKGFAPNVDWDTVDFSKSPAIQDMPVTSAICSPLEGESVTLEEGKVEVKGYAYSGGGRKIIRVDVSSDGGKNWQAADELVSDNAKHPYAWGWTLWKAKIPVKKGQTNIELVAKAVDSSYNTQPENFENIWNLRGVLAHAYHRVNVKVK